MSEQEKTDLQDMNQEDERLNYECEQAFLRRRFEEPSAEEAWRKFRHGVMREETLRTSFRQRSRLVYWAIGAASVAAGVLILFGLLMYNVPSAAEKGIMTLYTASVLPEAVTVEELLDNEEVVSRSVISHDDELKIEQKGAVILPHEADYTRSEGERVRTGVLSIPCGQVYKITLSDGTEVWLNADSRLIFPTRFTGARRLVRLEGEAYFNVARNEDIPFVIETETFTTQVLGTEFNIKTYKNSEAHVTLVDGSVKVRMPAIGKEVMLIPDEDITYAENNFQVKKVDTSYYTQWRDGYFYFDDMHLSDILSDLGRWYNITIEMEQDSLLMNQRLHFIADRSEDIDQVIENLNAFEYLSVSKKENKLTVRRKK